MCKLVFHFPPDVTAVLYPSIAATYVSVKVNQFAVIGDKSRLALLLPNDWFVIHCDL